MNPYNKVKSRQVSAGKTEHGRFLEPAQLLLQATGSTVIDKQQSKSTFPRREVVDFRITKDTGLVKSVDLGTMSTSQPVASRKAQQTGEMQTIVGIESGPGFRISNTKTENEFEPEDGRHSHSNSITNQAQPFLPGDRVIFAESPHSVGTLIVYRPAEEKSANPDRLNLDRRKLTVCPVLDGEEQLRLLNYQHNFIRKISNLHGLRRLIFLDLYDNQVEEISGLGSLKSLRVLMLGKNRIKKIENLEGLTKLDVLDLHGNEIQHIENLNHLNELRVLNLAGNKITCSENMDGLDALTELNLRRNVVRQVLDLDLLPSIQRLFLSFNEISSFEDVSCIANCVSLVEVTFDGNPFANDPAYKQIVLRNIPLIKQLDLKRVTDEEKRIANIMARKEEDKRKEFNKIAVMKERRRLAISNAKRQWEIMQSTLMGKSNRLSRMPELYASHIGSYQNEDSQTRTADGHEEEDPAVGVSQDSPGSESGGRLRPQSADVPAIISTADAIAAVRDSQRKLDRMGPKQRSRSESRPGVIRAGGDLIGPPGQSPRKADGPGYYAEIESDTLTFYGPGSLEYLDKNWGVQAAGAVTTIAFKFIDFTDIVSKAFVKVRSRFPAVHSMLFTANNMHSLAQINALAQTRRVDHLTIETDGNSVTELSFFKSYVMFRLAHFSLKSINGQEVTPLDIITAERLFGSVARAVATLPSSRLVSLINDPRKRQLLTEDRAKRVGSGDEGKLLGGGLESVGKAALTFSVVTATPKESSHRHTSSRILVTQAAKEALAINNNRLILEKLWPKLFADITQRAAAEMIDIDVYSKKCMEQFLAGE